MFDVQRVEIDWGGRPLVLETGRMARQSDGSVLARYGGTGAIAREERRKVIALGGLHVLGTERHESLRIDRQLIGRAGHQGDPGSCQFFLSLEDELLEGLGEDAQEYFRELGQAGGDRNWQGYHKYFVEAQRRLERRHYRNRVDLMVYEKRRQEVLKDLGADPYVD